MQDTDSTDNQGVTKPTIPEVLDRFVAYHRAHPTWGALHAALEDGNVRDHHIQWDVDHTTGEAYELAKLLLRMSTTQRLKLPDVVEAINREHERRPRAPHHLQLISGRVVELVATPRPAPPADVVLAVPVYGFEVTP